ncbi:MAG: nickel pincer cofactor biosynthesis protein LarB [Thermoleophilia bacterium]|nr:nickel pincer cofactor biosynthesis protein LarB [Thermoleophilia bacterium]
MKIREILGQLARGEISLDEADSRLALLSVAHIGEFARLDLGRHGRKGVPEVVYAPGKSAEQVRKISAGLIEHSGRAIISGLDREGWQDLATEFDGMVAAGNEAAGTLVVRGRDYEKPAGGGKVGILTAGTADVAVAEQARIMAEEMGCDVFRAYDVGVAGVHRLAEPLSEMVDAGVAVMIVAAGMEGALPSVVAGLVAVPVIGLPTSTGYGLGGEGVTALLSMLQSCCPGLVAVNIDNGIGAGATAALIANQAV